jgi:hypothetical protein
MEQYHYEILRDLAYLATGGKPDVYNPRGGAFGVTQITEDAWKELVARWPEKYKGKGYPKALIEQDVANQAGQDYLSVVLQYLTYYKIPETMESIVIGYLWGVGNLRKKGLEEAPDDYKYFAAKIRHRLQPQAENLDLGARKR